MDSTGVALPPGRNTGDRNMGERNMGERNTGVIASGDQGIGTLSGTPIGGYSSCAFCLCLG
jgi:hypothetical protein